MPGDITDTTFAVRATDPALVHSSGDPEHKLPATEHEVALPPVYAGQATYQDQYDDGNNRLLPTMEELHTLRRVPDHIPLKVYTIAFVELVERCSFYGATAVFVNFVQFPAPTPSGAASDPNSAQAQPGALNMGQRASTGITTFNQFWVYLVPLFGAYIADTYLGRFHTIVYSVIIAEIGHVLLTASAAPSLIAKPHSCLALFIIGIIVMGLGTGGFKPNISPLVAEQIPNEGMRVETTKKGERVIIDPAATSARIYNYFYLFINIGALVGQVAMVYAERYVGFWLAYFVPTALFLMTLPVLWFCRGMYKRTPPEGSVLGPSIKLFIMALKGRWHLNPLATWRHWNDGTFWENVKPSHLGGAKPAWMTFDDAWVDEVARGWSSCSVFLWFPLYWLTYNQLNNNLTSQAATMQLGGVPNDIVNNLDPFALIIFIPICDLVIYPALRRAGINFTPIKRITAGFFMGSAAMIWATVVQYYIYKTSTCGEQASSDCPGNFTVWAQTGSYVLIAFSEIFASITSLEYAFTKAPKNMRSLVMSFSLFMTALAAAIGEAFITLSNNPLLVWNYGSMAVISFIAGCLFWIQYRALDAAEDKLNMLPTGHLGTETQAAEIERRMSLPEKTEPEKTG